MQQPPTRSAPATCPNRRGTRLSAQQCLTQAPRRLAGVPAEALAEFAPAWIERVRGGDDSNPRVSIFHRRPHARGNLGRSRTPVERHRNIHPWA